MDLLYLKLLLTNIYLVTCFDFYHTSKWEILVKSIIEFGGDSVKLDSLEDKWIEQPLDHFDKNEKRSWKMRYFEDLSMWQSGGPVILLIGGEAEAIPLKFGLLYELASETNAAVYFSEHRYYGKSMPLRNLTVSNFKYLDSQQALHDNANLLKFIKSNPKFSTSKVVAVGGSYAGNLAAWIRLLFPQLVDAAISSSAPVLAKKDFFEYLEVMGDVIKNYGTHGCYENFSNEFARKKELFKTASGIEQIKKEYYICAGVDFTKKENVMYFFMYLMWNLMRTVQYGSPVDIQRYCINPPNYVFLNLSATDMACIDFNADLYFKIYATNPWIYQTCTAFGYFITGNSKRQPFTDTITLDFHLAFCKGAFGPEFNEQKIEKGIAQTNKMFGGLNPDVKQVVFVNGEMDPWSALGIKNDLSPDAPALVIKAASHCSDFLPVPVNEDARIKWELIKGAVKYWLGQ